MNKLLFNLLSKLGVFSFFPILLLVIYLIALDLVPGSKEIKDFFYSEKVTSELKTAKLMEIQSRFDLITAERDYVVHVPLESSREFLGTEVGTSGLVYMGVGTVSAGVRMDEVTIEDIHETENGLVLNLPAPKIISIQMDSFKSMPIGSHKTPLGPDNLQELTIQGQQEAHLMIAKEACQDDLLEEARQNAQRNLDFIIKTQVAQGTCL